MHMKTQSILLAAMLSLVGAAASAQTSAVDQVKKDNAVIRQDTKEIRNENRDINKDNAAIRRCSVTTLQHISTVCAMQRSHAARPHDAHLLFQHLAHRRVRLPSDQ